jgi:threonine dehydratase
VNDHALARSVKAGRVVEHEDAKPTLSDGTAGGVEPGSITLPLASALVDDWVLVEEAEIRAAMRDFIANESLLLEGAAGAAIAGVLKRARDTPKAFEGKRVAILICGGRIDLKKLAGVVA